MRWGNRAVRAIRLIEIEKIEIGRWMAERGKGEEGGVHHGGTERREGEGTAEYGEGAES